jgi:chaperonin GroES
MQLVCVLLVVLFASATSFSRIVPVRRLALRANKIDGITIDGALTPISNNVLIKVKEAASSTSGGLYIPDNAKERPTEGIVVAAGPGRVHPETAKQLAMAVHVGHSVMYGKYDGTELKYNDVNHQMIKDDDILLTYTGPVATLESVQCVKDQVLVRLPPKEESNLSGIIIATPGSSEKRPNHGVVAKVGPGRQAGNGEVMKPQVQTGDGVRFREYGGSMIKLDGQEYIVVRAHDILAKW